MQTLILFWMMGAIALFAEEPKKLKFFNLDLHISVIADVKNIFEELGHEVTNWSLSGHTWVFGRDRDPVEIINENTWTDLSDERCCLFYERYKDFLEQFDGFIVTHNASFALLYAKLNKPIIIVNSTRYENPFTRSQIQWDSLNKYLRQGVEKNKIFIVSNNKGDQNYLKRYSGIDSEWIPSLCLYTKGQYTGKNDKFYVHALWDSKKFNDWFETFYYKTNLFTSLPWGYRWQDLYDLKGVVHFPYQISTMSLFEQYSACVPIFFPTKEFLFELHEKYPETILAHLSFLRVPDLENNPRPEEDLNNFLNPKIVKEWIEWADYYDTKAMPHIQYFSSFEHLESLLRTVDTKSVSQKMKRFTEKRKRMVFKKWRKILEKVEENL